MADVTNRNDAAAASRIADVLGARWRMLSLGAVLLLATAGWGWLALAVALGGTAADAGFGMSALQPLFDRLSASLPGYAAAGAGHGPLMPGIRAWTAGDFALVLAMWAAMVFAMMLPTAAPTFRAYARDGRTVAAVMAGYTAVWLAAAVAGASGQAALVALGALAPHMAPAGAALSASVLVAAGLYQFTPLKAACLARCRNPRTAEVTPRFAFRIGVEEGLACLGCCWALMAVMFAAGLMNLVAMAILGAAMAAEKVAGGRWLTPAIGVVLLGAGGMLAAGLVAG